MPNNDVALLTLELLDRFAQAGCQCKLSDPVVLARFQAAFVERQWFAVCYHPRIRSFFGLATRAGWSRPRWAWFSLDELLSLRGRRAGRGVELWEPPPGWRRGDPTPSPLLYPLRVELDAGWVPAPLSETGLLPD